MGSLPSLLSRWSDTSVRLTGRRPADPWKITSSILPPRSNRADCSPSTQRTASETFDFPHPLGPTMLVTPSPKSRATVSANDLKPESSSLVSFIYGPGTARGGSGRQRRRVTHKINNSVAEVRAFWRAVSGQSRRGRGVFRSTPQLPGCHRVPPRHDNRPLLLSAPGPEPGIHR